MDTRTWHRYSLSLNIFLGQDIENICNINKLAGIVSILYEDAF